MYWDTQAALKPNAGLKMQQKQSDETCDGRVLLNPLFLKRLRQKRGLSQDGLAEECSDNRLCLSLASIKRAEAGRPVLYRTARHLATFYCIALDHLLAPTAASELVTSFAQPVAITHAARDFGWDRRRGEPSTSAIYFTIAHRDLNEFVQRQVTESGARTLANPAGTELAIVFGAPAHRSADAFSALQCALKLRTTAACAGNLILRRRAIAELFAEPPIVISNFAFDNSIFLEATLASQLSELVQFELGGNQLAGCKRFLRFNGVHS